MAKTNNAEKPNDIFRPRARLLLQLGDQLIKNERIAIVELVKNSYDADATLVSVNLQLNKDKITIKDNGWGMNEEIIRNVWLEPGSDYKRKILDGKNYDSQFSRKPLGEKGIGRFGVHKLGENIEIISRMAKEKEVVVIVNWKDFEKAEYIDEVKIDISERTPEVFLGKETGTLIRVSKLRQKQWLERNIKEIANSLIALVSPFDKPDSFEVVFETDRNDLLEDIPNIESIKEHALYHFSCSMKGSEIISFEYSFNPYTNMKEIEGRTIKYIQGKETKIAEYNFNVLKNLAWGKTVKNETTGKREQPSVDLEAEGKKIGTVKIEGFIFDRQKKVLRLSNCEPKFVTDYLDLNGGVRVYRDGVRVYDYGEPENDWLNLEKSRLYDPGVKLSKSLLLGAVHIDRETSQDLIEKTNREGFVENKAYFAFRDSISYALSVVEIFRNQDKEKIIEKYGPSRKSEPILESINELRELIQTKVDNKPLRKECIAYLNKIEKDYTEINEVLLTSAEAGLNLGIAIHEIEKIVKELKRLIHSEKSSDQITKIVLHLSSLIDTYAVLIKKASEKEQNLIALVEDALGTVQYRLKIHNVELLPEYKKYSGKSMLKCSERLIISSILNLIDNSIYWLDRAKIVKKQIFVSLNHRSSKVLRLIVADNGTGFGLPPEQMIKPFVSLRPGGMGLGLHIVSEIMSGQGGSIEFPRFSELKLPKGFDKGAIVALDFKVEN